MRSVLCVLVTLSACDGRPAARSPDGAALPDEPSPLFRNVANQTAYVGDSACAGCHASEAAAYGRHAMARSFHPWTPSTRIETPLDSALYDAPTGFHYSVVDSGGRLYQVEFLAGPGGRRLHELRRRIDYVMGSGEVARTYFTEENGRLFQLPLTWYRQAGWDFSPGYEIDNARFDRLLPDRCIACHSSYPEPVPHLEGKYAELRPGIGCERCHGPGALHVRERREDRERGTGDTERRSNPDSAAPPAPSGSARVTSDSAIDNTIVNPARLPLARRLDVCEQCHVHTTVAVLREGKDELSYVPSEPLRDVWAYFKVAGDIDIVSHADRLRQSACFLATRTTARPLECATCHDPHEPPPAPDARNQPCLGCHSSPDLQRRLMRQTVRADHAPAADCVRCHMPAVKDRAVPHGTFTDHWIRVVTRDSTRPAVPRVEGPIEPFFERDRTGPEAEVYRRMGEVVYATLANDGRLLAGTAAALERALGSDTTRGDAHFLAGVAYQQLGRTADAMRALERAVRADSSDPERLRALAQAYERAGRPPEEIDRLYRRALSLQPALAWIRADYGDFLQAQGRRAEAERAYRTALAERPSLAVAWFNLGTVLAATDRLDEASGAFQEAVHLDPSLGQALSPLLEVRTAGPRVTAVQSLGSPLATLPVRERGPRAVRLTIRSDGVPGLRVINLPPGARVQILEPDGTPVRTLPPPASGMADWDLRTDAGAPIGGGLYRARIQGRDASGRPRQLQIYVGVVRR